MITLRQLRYFESLSRHLHFGKAADECAISQPALSVQVQELEEMLELQLVERRRDGVVLTVEGREISRRARRVLGDVRDIADFAKVRHGLVGDLSLGIIPTIAPYLLPAALPLLRKTYPGLHLKVRETLTAILLGELVQGGLDLIIAAMPLEHPDIEAIRLFDDAFVLAIPKSRAKEMGSIARIDKLDQERLLLLEEGHCLRAQALGACRRDEITEAEVFGTTSLSTLVQMVVNGLGITLLPELSLAVEGRDRRLSLLKFGSPQPHRTVGMAWRKSSPRKRDYTELGKVLSAARIRRGKS